MSCCAVLLTCPAVMLLILQLKTWRLSILMRSDQDRSWLFRTCWFVFKFGWLCFMACHIVDVLVPDYDRPASASRQDGKSIGQDGK